MNNITGGSATDLECVTQLNTVLAAGYKNALSAASLFRGMQIQNVFPLPVLVSQTDTTSAGVGGAGANVVPGNVAGIGKWLTPNSGRKFRGRLYFPWVATTSVTSAGLPTAGYLTTILAWMNLIPPGFTISGSGGGTAGIVAVIRHKDNTTIQITGTAVESGFGSMKRRGFFGRTNLSPI